MKTVSIILPVYNVEKYLRECVDSLLCQTYSKLEIVLVDDGSTDESGRICDRYVQQDPRVVVIHQANAGAANAKNAGLDWATGDYITFMDSDDYAEFNWIARMVEVTERYGADVVECDFDKVYRNRSEVANQYKENSVYTAEEYLAQYLGNWTCSLFWNKLFRRELLSDVRFRRERRCIDDEFFTYKAVTGANRIVRITDVLYHYRQRASSAVASTRNRLQITDDALEILIERYRWISRFFPRLRKVYLRHDVDIMLCFARDFIFTEETVKKFRETASFFLKESILHWCGRVTLIYALRLQRIKLRRDRSAGNESEQTDTSEYFA